MQRTFMFWTFSLLMAGVCSAVAADDLFVVCHAGVTLAAADVRDVYLGEKEFVNTVRLMPVDNIAEQSEFLDKVLRMNAAKYATTWAKKSFRDGINPPVTLANDAAVLEFIRRTPGGCGYLGIAPLEGVAVIAKY
jgi:hypothetical protein